MSEIKGQILGIILTIGVFAAVFGVLCSSFGKTAKGIQTRMDNALTYSYEEDEENEGEYKVTHDNIGENA